MTTGVRREDVYSLGQTIFCQFNNKILKLALEECAKEIGCHIWNGAPGSPDIVAIPAFIVIVDRQTVGKELWSDYVKFCEEVDDDVPCLIVDSLKDWPLPDMKYVKQFDMKQPDSILTLTDMLKDIKKQNLPIELQHKEFPIRQIKEIKYDESKGWIKSEYFKYD